MLFLVAVIHWTIFLLATGSYFISHLSLSHWIRVIGWVLTEGSFFFCRQNALPNANALHSSRANADLSLPLGGNGRMHGITTVKQRCPSGDRNIGLLWLEFPFPCSSLLCVFFVPNFLNLSHFCWLSPLCCVSVFCLYFCLLALHLIIESTNFSSTRVSSLTFICRPVASISYFHVFKFIFYIISFN